MSTPPPSPRSSALVLTGGLLVALLTSARLIQRVLAGDPLPLLGAPGGEVWGHAWVQWWHAHAWPAWPHGPDAWVTTTRDWPVIDPLPTFVAATVGAASSAVLAYDLVVLLGVVGAFIGGAVLARSQGGAPLVGGLALALAPAFLGTVASGLTEDLAIGLAAAGLGWVGSTDWRRALAAGLCLGVLSACGLVLAWTAAMAAVGIGTWAWLQSSERGKVGRGLVLGGSVAGLLALPTAWMHAARLTGEGHRLGTFVPRPEPLWRLNPWQGVDLASFWVPGAVDPGDALVRMHPGYLGWSLLLLGLLAGRSRWWVVLLAAVLVAPGAHLSVAGSPTGVDNPVAALVNHLPFGELVNHHGRLLLLGSIALSVLASLGASSLKQRFGPRALWAALAIILVDLALLGPVGAPLPIADATPLAVYTNPGFDSLPDGPILHLPASGPGVHFQRPLLDQRIHQRPLALNPNRPGLAPADARTPTGRFMSALAAPESLPVPEAVQWPSGVSVVVTREPYVDRMIELLGPPDLRATDSAAWSQPLVDVHSAPEGARTELPSP